MAIELYHADYSTCSQKVRLVLAEKGIPFTSHALSFRKEEQLSADYLRINPNGVVPALVHDGEAIIDSSCIIEYLDEVFTQVPLAPATPLGRAKMRKWLRYMEEVPTTAIRIPSFEGVFLPVMRLVGNANSFEKSKEKRTLRKGFYGRMNSGKGFDPATIQDSVYQLRDTAVRMATALRDSDWIVDGSFGLVDAALLPLIDRAEDLGMEFLWDDLPAVGDWLGRARERPSFAQAFYKKSRLSERLEFKLAIRSLRKRNSELSLSDFGVE